MPNPGTFIGPRGDFLRSQLDMYAQAVRDGDANDILAIIQRRYFKRWPITLPHDQEQTEEWLQSVDDDAPEADLEEPNVELMTPEDATKALEDFGKLMKDLKARKDAIKRRMHYMYTKELQQESAASSTKSDNDPMSIILGKLTGVDLKVPRMKTAYNIWGPKNRDVVDPVFKQRVEDGQVPIGQHLALRSAVYKELFEKLPAETQDEWNKTAVREHEKAIQEVKAKRRQAISQKPEDRQRVINNLSKIMEPILDLVGELTGWRGSLVFGGPEPADSGRLNMVWVHSGVMPGTVKMNFGRAERIAFKDAVTPAFGSYLKKCYPMDECRSVSLPQDHNMPSLSQSTSPLNENVEFHSFTIDKEHIEASKSHKKRKILEDFVESENAKAPKSSRPPTGTPSPPVRLGPPVGKKKQRELPSKDKPKTSTAPKKSSPLVQAPVISANNAGSANAPVSKDSDPTTASQSKTSLPTPPPPSRAASAAPGAPSRPASPAPSRPVSPAPSRPASPAPSRPASPAPSRPVSPAPSRPASPAPSRPASPAPSRPASPAPSRPVSPAPSHPGSAGPTQPVLSASNSATGTPPSGSPAPPSLHSRPSGTATVPDFSDISPKPPKGSRKRGEEGRAAIAAKRAQGSGGSGTNKRKATGAESPASKKRRTNVESADTNDGDGMAFDVDVADDCVPWVRNALDLLASEDLGLSWQGLVSAWLRFEAKTGFAEQGGKLPSKARPAVIGDWIKRARSPRCPPNLGDTTTFKKKYNAWWTSLQPKWRMDKNDGALKRDGDSWASLAQYSGVNGLLSVLACLFFWGSAPLPHSQRKAWDDAVDDALFVMESLASAA